MEKIIWNLNTNRNDEQKTVYINTKARAKELPKCKNATIIDETDKKLKQTVVLIIS